MLLTKRSWFDLVTKLYLPVFVSIVFLLIQGNAKADTIAYAYSGYEDFGILDLNTGAYTYLGTSGAPLGGMGEYKGKLYGGYVYGNAFYDVSPANGLATLAGYGYPCFDTFGSASGGLYGTCGSPEDLYSVNPATGAETFIGVTGVPLSGAYGSSNSTDSTLYLITDGLLYAVNTTTGAGTFIGDTGHPFIVSMMFDNGVLWGEDVSSDQIFRINPQTAALTYVSTFSGGLYAGYLYGIAPFGGGSAAPEPGTLALLATGLSALGWFGKRRKQ